MKSDLRRNNVWTRRSYPPRSDDALGFYDEFLNLFLCGNSMHASTNTC